MTPDMSQMTPLELAERSTYERSGWVNPYCEELCRRAGLLQKYLDAQGEDIQKIVRRAGKSFGIIII